MTTALTLAGKNELTLTQQAVMAEMESEGDAGFEFIPERIKFSSGGLLAFQTGDGGILQPPIDMIVTIAQRSRAYWPSKDTAGQPPLCSSRDGIEGYFDPHSEQIKSALAAETRHPALQALDVNAAVGPWGCAECALNQWGDGDAKAKPCKTLRRLAVLVKGWSAPAILTLPPTSVKVWDTFASGRKNRGRAYFDTWVRVTLVEDRNRAGIKFAKLALAVGDPLNEAETAEVIGLRHRYMELVRSLNIVADDYDTEGGTNGSGGATSEEELPPF